MFTIITNNNLPYSAFRYAGATFTPVKDVHVNNSDFALAM